MADELFYVGIRDPVEIRKELLTSSKNVIDSLRRYERYHELKEMKLQHVMRLKRVFDELLVLNKKLRGKLPKVPIRMPTIENGAERSMKAPTRKAPSHTKLDVLEDELSKIEQRLGSLE